MTREKVLESWLTVTLESHFRDEPPSALIERIMEAAHSRQPETAHRGLRLLVAAAVVAAAATVALLLWIPERTPTQTNQPGVAAETNDPTTNEDDEWAPLQTITSDADARVDTGADEAVLTRGSVLVEVEPGQSYRVIAGPHTVVLTGPAKARVTLTPMVRMGLTMVPPGGGGTGNPLLWAMRRVPMVALVMQLGEGKATLDDAELTGPVTEQHILYPKTGSEPWAAPLTMKELFRSLDESGNQQLAEDEITGELLNLLDADKSGGVTFSEFETLDSLTLEETPRVIPFSREFREMDRDDNGKLTGDEIGEEIVTIADTDGSGGLELAEAERVFGGGQRGAMVMDMFTHFDMDGDGEIGVDEIAPDVMLELDEDENGRLDRKEFAKFRPEDFPKPLTPAQQFRRNDANDDGELSDDEVPAVMIHMGDTDGDGKLSRAEFTKLVENMVPERK